MPPLVLVTGCNRGIGMEACKRLLGLGFDVVGTCRNPESLREGVPAVLKAIPLAQGVRKVGELALVKYELSASCKGVELVLNAVRNRAPDGLHAVIHNAGGPGGVETNYVATMLLNEKLLPVVKDSGRVVFLTSGTGAVMYCPEPGVLQPSLWGWTKTFFYHVARKSTLWALYGALVLPIVTTILTVLQPLNKFVYKTFPKLWEHCVGEEVQRATYALASDMPAYQDTLSKWFVDHRYVFASRYRALCATTDGLHSFATSWRDRFEALVSVADGSIAPDHKKASDYLAGDQYFVGKGLLNAYMRRLAKRGDVQRRSIKVYCVDPGSCRTGNNGQGWSTAAQGCVGAVALALGKAFATEPLCAKPHANLPDFPKGFATVAATTSSTPEPPSGSILTWRGVWCGGSVVANGVFYNNMYQLYA